MENLKQFVPQYLAVKLKELGFDETCFAYIKNIGNDPNNEKIGILSESSKSQLEENGILFIKIPLWQQAISFLTPMIDGDKFRIIIVKKNGNYLLQKSIDGVYKNLSDATNLDCIENLIEIVEEKQRKSLVD